MSSRNRDSDAQAADWLARRDRGLSAAEQDDYLQWLRDDPQRAALIARHEATVRRMQHLARWQPDGSSEPNPDLFARPRRRWWRGVALVGAAAAALVLGGLALQREPEPAAQVAAPPKSFLRVNERQLLADGSMVELRDGSRVEVMLSETERRVRLTGGEAHFNVTTNPARPFVVEAGKVVVRAIGTAFVVRIDSAQVDVMVTEGKVRLERPSDAGQPATLLEADGPIVAAHQRAIVPLIGTGPAPEVTAVTADQLKDALSWKAPRFQFYETPLADAVAEFNRHNAQQIRIVDEALGREPIGGTFRVDNVEGFVSLLELTLGITAERGAEGPILLRRAR